MAFVSLVVKIHESVDRKTEKVQLELNMEETQIINAKELREQLPAIVRRTRAGKRFLVLYRSKPAFELCPPADSARPLPPLEEDPVFRSRALGRSQDGLSSQDHDRVLYGR